MPRRIHQLTPFSPGGDFGLLGRGGSNSFSFLVTFDNGRVHAQLLNRRLTKGEVAKYLKTTEDGGGVSDQEGLSQASWSSGRFQAKALLRPRVFCQMQDVRWLGKVTDLLYEFVEEKNASQAKRRNNAEKGDATSANSHLP